MCGVLFVKSDSPSATRQIAKLRYYEQSKRGKSGFGVHECESGKSKKSVDEKTFIENINKSKSKALLLHHRLPTSTSNRQESAHPFDVTYGDLLLSVVHNGVISNPDEVLKAVGVKPEALSSYDKNSKKYNDSEALALDFIDAIATERKNLHSVGSIALMAHDAKNKKLYLYRNLGNPLKMYFDENLTVFASELPLAIDVTENKLCVYDMKSDKFQELREMISSSYKYHASCSPAGRDYYGSKSGSQSDPNRKPWWKEEEEREEKNRQKQNAGKVVHTVAVAGGKQIGFTLDGVDTKGAARQETKKEKHDRKLREKRDRVSADTALKLLEKSKAGKMSGDEFITVDKYRQPIMVKSQLMLDAREVLKPCSDSTGVARYMLGRSRCEFQDSFYICNHATCVNTQLLRQIRPVNDCMACFLKGHMMPEAHTRLEHACEKVTDYSRDEGGDSASCTDSMYNWEEIESLARVELENYKGLALGEINNHETFNALTGRISSVEELIFQLPLDEVKTEQEKTLRAKLVNRLTLLNTLMGAASKKLNIDKLLEAAKAK